MEMDHLFDQQFPEHFALPPWLILLFRIVGFALHASFMGLWYAGIPLALVWGRSQDLHARQLSKRLMTQMPIIVAFGINLGIVPLLFLQVGFGPIFYTATILMAWHWFAVVVLLIFAYYAVYLYSWTRIPTDKPISNKRLALGLFAAVAFIAIGFMFSNAFSLMSDAKRWPILWERTVVAGAVTGLTLNVDDPGFWPRWLFIFSLAIQTTAAWMVLEAGIFGRGLGGDYPQKVLRMAAPTYTVGTVALFVFSIWHLRTLEKSWDSLIAWPSVVGTGAAFLLPVVLTFVLWSLRTASEPLKKANAALFAISHLIVLLCNSFLRITADLNHLSAPRYEFWNRPVSIQWSPIVLFAVTLIAGIAVVSWMIIQVIKNYRPSAEDPLL
jgi:hypothetical protein